MVLNYQWTERDYVALQLRLLGKRPLTLLRALVYPALILFLAIWTLLENPSDWKRPVGGLALAAALVFLPLAYSRWRWVRQFRASRSWSGPTTLIFDDNGVELRGEGTQSRTSWTQYRALGESSRFFTLNTSSKDLLVIPKSALSMLQIEELRSVVNAHLQTSFPRAA